ncbi:MAG: outer membrane beta-barrel protein [Anaeromyxobacteraceae bacterium]
MRKLLVAAVLALVSPLAASAQVGLGAKLGISFPIGDADRGEQLKDITSIQVPLELSLNFHVTPAVKLGGYGGYAFAKTGSIVQDSCDFYGEDCTQHSWRAGVKGEVALGSGAPGSFRPYVGANWGWEWNVTKMEQFGEWGKMNISGWELGIEGGADSIISPQLTAGFFVNLAFGSYGKIKTTYSSGAGLPDDSFSIPSADRETHAWLTLGVRGNFDLQPAGY